MDHLLHGPIQGQLITGSKVQKLVYDTKILAEKAMEDVIPDFARPFGGVHDFDDIDDRLLYAGICE